MPPGAVASTRVAGAMPAIPLSAQAASAVSPMPVSVVTATTIRNRGACAKNAGVKRDPSDAPIASCPAMIIGAGSALQV